ncbi:MAG: DUF4238 domain-containing protein [Ignavibacteria bacterium]|nr:DUF4238 domain-containing protein [Ignavibacteria bacterium]
MNQFRRDSHFLPSLYLRKWSTDGTRVWLYRLLVSRHDVPDWKRASIKGIAYHQHLYTRIVAGSDSDEFERWLDAEFESPAKEALDKATSDRRLLANDWKRLIMFATSQDVRTPKKYIEHLQRWVDLMPNLLDDTLRNAVQELETSKQTGKEPKLPTTPPMEPIPLAVSTHIENGADQGILKAEVVVGRQSWLSSMRYLLTNTARVLLQHKWTIIHAPDNLRWFTSDDPFIRLNYYKAGSYDFRGGWGNKGTELLLPLSPLHLLYTKVGQRSSLPVQIPAETARLLQRMMAEHAHRFIISSQLDDSIPALRTRKVDPIAFQQERNVWREWHKQQTDAEQALARKSDQAPAPNGG